jgi:hypothetical protein
MAREKPGRRKSSGSKDISTCYELLLPASQAEFRRILGGCGIWRIGEGSGKGKPIRRHKGRHE